VNVGLAESQRAITGVGRDWMQRRLETGGEWICSRSRRTG
jgi:hypothetical protein